MGRDSARWGKAFHTWCLQTEASTRLELFRLGTVAVADRKEVVVAGGGVSSIGGTKGLLASRVSGVQAWGPRREGLAAALVKGCCAGLLAQQLSKAMGRPEL